MHTILMLPRCPISKVIDSWKFAIGDSLFAFEYNPTFTNGDLVTIQLTWLYLELWWSFHLPTNFDISRKGLGS
jgi:hypothetical protein